MAKKLSKKELFNLIKEAVAKKVNLLGEDIDIDDDNLDNDWNKNTPNEDTRYYERLETDPLDGDVLDLSANESRVYNSIKKMIEAKIRKNPSAFGLQEKKINEIGDTTKEFMKEEVDMGQIPAVSDRRSTAKEYSPEVKKEIRKLRYMIDDYEKEGKDTSELTKRIQKLKQQ